MPCGMAHKLSACSGDTAYKNHAKEGNHMEFLREILGEELYKQLETAINAYNGNEANKDHPVKIGNLGGGCLFATCPTLICCY